MNALNLSILSFFYLLLYFRFYKQDLPSILVVFIPNCSSIFKDFAIRAQPSLFFMGIYYRTALCILDHRSWRTYKCHHSRQTLHQSTTYNQYHVSILISALIRCYGIIHHALGTLDHRPWHTYKCHHSRQILHQSTIYN